MVSESEHADTEVELVHVAVGADMKVTLTLSALPPAPMICSLVVKVADPVLALTLKLAPTRPRLAPSADIR
jgi:hypothetical protein